MHLALLITTAVLSNAAFAVAQTCLDSPPNWKDRLGEGCDSYRNNQTWCASAANYKDRFGVDARSACCVCGGGDKGQSDKCRDNTGWEDSAGENCEAYKRNRTWCSVAEHYKDRFGVDAKSACCVCGGGSGGQNDSCTDNTRWKDSGNFGCDSYQKYPQWCDKAARYASSDGKDARTECCVCKNRSDDAMEQID